MSLELLHPSDPHLALDVYRSALPFFAALQSELGLNVVPPCCSRSVANGSSTPTTVSSAPSSRPESRHHHYPHLCHSVAQLPTLAQVGGKPDLSLFVPLKELWRWVERLLWRAVILTAQVCDIRIDDAPPSASVNDSHQVGTSAQGAPPVSLWTYLAYYAASSVYWPPTFRSAHRTTVGMIHLRAFVLRYGPAGGSLLSSTNMFHPPTPTNAKCSKSSLPTGTNIPESSSSSTPCRPPWITEALYIINTQRAILTASTKFPRAGERNVPVEDFAELVVRVWEVWVGWSIGFGFADGDARAKGRWSDTEGVDPIWVIDVCLSTSRRQYEF